MPDKEFLLVYTRLDTEQVLPATNQNPAYSYFYPPAGVTGDKLYGLTRKGLRRYYGDVDGVYTSDCGITPPPPPADPPVWTSAPAPPVFTPGEPWNFPIPALSVTPAAGQSLYKMEMTPGSPSYLDIVFQPPNYVVYGTIPADLAGSALPFSVRATQFDNLKTADQAFSAAKRVTTPTDIKAVVQLPAGIIRVGPSYSSPPEITIISGPSGYTSPGTIFGKGPKSETVGGVNYFYFATDTFIPGTYIVQIKHLGALVYAQFTWDGSTQAIVLTITATKPGDTADYSLAFSATSLPEGSNVTCAAYRKQGAQNVPVPGSTYELESPPTGTTIAAVNDTSGRISKATNTTTGDGYQQKVIARLNGVVIATGYINVVDTSPVLTTILAITEEFTITSDVSQNTVRFAIKVNQPDGVQTFVFGAGGYAGPFTAIANPASEYQYAAGFSCGAPGAEVRIKFRPTTNPDAFIEIKSVVPNASLNNHQVYPLGPGPLDPNDKSSYKFKGYYE